MVIRNLFKPFARITRARYFWAGLAVIVTLAALLACRTSENYRLYFGMYHDDAIYMVCAKSLAQGLGYRILSLPTEPLQTKYPIGFPLYLSIFWKCFPSFPDNLRPIVAGQTAIGLAAAVVSACYFLYFRKITPLMGLVICGASLLNSRYLDLSPMIMSDFVCIVLSMLCIWRTEVVSQKSFSWKDSLLLGVLILIPPMVRFQAICGPAACLGHLVWKKRYKIAAIVVLVCAPVLAAELWWQVSNAAKAPQFLAFYTGYFPRNWSHLEAARYLLSLKMSFEWGRFMQMGTYFPFVYNQEYRSLQNPVFAIAIGLAHYGLVILGILAMLRELRRRSAYALAALLGAAPVLVFPVLVDWRQLVPPLPGFYYFLFLGSRSLARLIKPKYRLFRKPYQLICAAVAITFSSYLVLGAATESLIRSQRYARHIGLDAPRMSSQAGNSEYNEALYWIDNNTVASDVFLCNDDPLLYLYSGHHAVAPWRTDVFGWLDLHNPGDIFLAAIEFAHPQYLMEDPMHRRAGHGRRGPAEDLARALAKLYPGSVIPVFASSHDLIHIWKIHPEHLPASVANQYASQAGTSRN